MQNAKYQKAFKDSKNNLFLRSAQYGVEIEGDAKPLERTLTSSGIAFFISVPERSELKLDDGSEASGEALAKWFKQAVINSHDEVLYGTEEKFSQFRGLIDFKVSVKYKTRDEVWTRAKEAENTLNMMVKLAIADKLINEESGEK